MYNHLLSCIIVIENLLRMIFMKKNFNMNDFYKPGKDPFKKFRKMGLPGLLITFVILLIIYFTYEEPKIVENGVDINDVESLVKYEVTVDHHIDGDTTSFYFNDESYSFRYLLIDTPEIGRKNGEKDEPFAREALHRVEELLDNAEHIYVMFDQSPTDKYDRYLVYVYADDTMVNEQLVKEGLAEVKYVYEPNTTYENKMKQAENEAKKKNVGMWENN